MTATHAAHTSPAAGEPLPPVHVEHPSWCDPRSCSVYPTRSGGVEVFHRVVPLGHVRLNPCIEVVSYVHLDAAGAVVAGDGSPPRVFLRDLDDVEMTADQAGGLAIALALASAVLRGAGDAR